MELNYDNLTSLAVPVGDTDDENHLYALIDHGAMPKLIAQLNRYKVSWTSLFEGSRDEGALEVAPILIQIRSGKHLLAPRTLVNWLQEQGRYASSLLFLYSPLDTAELARRLALRLDLSLPDGVDVVLRFFDGRVFGSLMNVLQVEEKAGFLCPAQAWWYVDRIGNLVLCKSCFSETESPLVPLALGSTQEAAMIDASEIDQVAMLLGVVMPHKFESMHEVDRVSFLTNNIAAARSYNITAPNDLTLYCSMALTLGDSFDRGPAWAGRLAKINAGLITMNDAMQNDAS